MAPATRYLVNGRRAPLPPGDGAGPLSRPIDLHRRLPGYAPTPLRPLDDLARELGIGRLWLKDESSRLGLPAFKMLGASWATYRTLVERLGHEPDWATVDELAAALAPLRPLRLCTATDGNHGRAVARTARMLGLAAAVFVPAGTAAARIDAIRDEGATVEVVDGTYDDAVAHAAEVAAADPEQRTLVVSDTSWPGYETVPRWVIDGYTTIFDEIDEALAGDAAPDLVVIQIGVGALAAAAAEHERDRPTRLLGVEPLHADCMLASVAAGGPTVVPGPHDSIMAGLNCGAPSLLALPLVAARFDAFVAVADEAARRAMRDLDRAGVEAGETGAAGLAGLREALTGPAEVRAALGLGPDATVLLINTEGATDPVAYERIVGHPPAA